MPFVLNIGCSLKDNLDKRWPPALYFLIVMAPPLFAGTLFRSQLCEVSLSAMGVQGGIITDIPAHHFEWMERMQGRKNRFKKWLS